MAPLDSLRDVTLGPAADRTGNNRDNTLKGTKRADTLDGRGGDDKLVGKGGNDDIVGGSGSDTLLGGGGRDELLGGNGRDLLDGGKGNDLLDGGSGGDIFRFVGKWGSDTIRGFDGDGGDVLDFSKTNLDFGSLTITQTRAGTLIEAGSRSILLEDVRARDVEPSWFEFERGKNDPDDSGNDDKIGTGGGGGRTTIGVGSNEGADLIDMDLVRGDPDFAGYTGQGYTVVILDTGIDLNHPAFGPDNNGDGISDRIVYTQDFTNDGDGTADDVDGHGSNVSSIIASSNPDYLGVVPGADIIHLQVLDNEGSGSFADMEEALQWVAANAATYNIVAVNMSIQDFQNVNVTASHPDLGDEYAALANAGIVTAVCAGNAYFDYQVPGHSRLATDPNVIPVGAVWEGDFGTRFWGSGAKDNTTGADRVTSFSQRSTDLGTIYAPGALITGAGPGGGTIDQGGTSQATPYITGLAVLAQQAAEDILGRRLTPSEYHQLLLDTAETIFDGDDENDNVDNLEANIPRVNAYNLLSAIRDMGPDDPDPEPVPEDDFGGGTGTSGRVEVGGSTRGEIETPSDADWFAVSLREGSTYRFELQGVGGGGGTLEDPFLTLFNGAADPLARNDDDPAGGRDSVIEFTAQNTGTFFLAATGYGSGTGTYTISAELVERRVEDDFAADDSTTSRLRPDGADTSGTIETTGDRDWHRLNASVGVTYIIDLVGGTGPDELADPLLELFDSAGNRIGFNDNSGGTDNSQLTFTAPANGDFFFAASAADGAGTGSYAMRVRIREADGTEGDVPNDPSTEARVEVGGRYDGELRPEGDRDWIKVNLSGGSVYDISMTGRGGDPLADPYLRIFDARGNELASNDDYEGSRDSFLEAFSPTSSGTYYVSAGSYRDAGAGNYRVQVTEASGGDEDIPADLTTGSTLAVDGAVDSTLDFAGDRDWHSVTLQGGRSYRIDLVGSGDNPVADTYLRAYDSRANLLAQDDDSGADRNSSLVLSPGADGTYFFSAGAYNDAGEGQYTISLADLGRVDDIAGDATTEATVNRKGRKQGQVEVADDKDWVAFDVEAGGEYRFDLRGKGNARNKLEDPLLVVRDQFGNELAYDDNSGSGDNSRIVYRATETGRIYLEVSSAGEDDTGKWKILTRTLSEGNDDHPNDFVGNALLEDGSPIVGDIEEAGDLDVFRFEGEAGKTYQIDVLGGPTGDGTLSDSILGIFDSSGNILPNGFNDDEPGGTFNSQVTFEALYSGDYYAVVAGYDFQRTGTYTVTLEESGGGSVGGDDYPNDPSTLGTLDAFGWAYGSLEDPGDRDWIGVFLEAGRRVDFVLYGAESGFGTLADPYFRLYDANGLLVAENDDDTTGFLNRESRLIWDVPATGTYYMEAGAFNDAEAGEWTMGAFYI